MMPVQNLMGFLMKQRPNELKERLSQGNCEIGLWCSLGSALTTEIIAGSGCDWILIDGEHSPNDLLTVMGQLQAVANFDAEPIVRLPNDDPNLIKQFMDVGARNLMVPNVRTAEQAKRIIASTRYAPEGHRGFSVGHRANQFGRIQGYHKDAHQSQLLVLQIECAEGVKNAAEIAALDGADVLFVGPGDLSTNLNAMGNPGADHVQDAIRSVLDVTHKAGKVSGILAPVRADAERYMSWGCGLVAVGADLGLLARGSDALVASFREGRS